MDEIKDDFDLGNYLDEQDRALFGEDPGIMENDLLGEVLTEDAPLWAASADVPFEPDENHSNELDFTFEYVEDLNREFDEQASSRRRQDSTEMTMQEAHTASSSSSVSTPPTELADSLSYQESLKEPTEREEGGPSTSSPLSIGNSSTDGSEPLGQGPFEEHPPVLIRQEGPTTSSSSPLTQSIIRTKKTPSIPFNRSQPTSTGIQYGTTQTIQESQTTSLSTASTSSSTSPIDDVLSLANTSTPDSAGPSTSARSSVDEGSREDPKEGEGRMKSPLPSRKSSAVTDEDKSSVLWMLIEEPLGPEDTKRKVVIDISDDEENGDERDGQGHPPNRIRPSTSRHHPPMLPPHPPQAMPGQAGAHLHLSSNPSINKKLHSYMKIGQTETQLNPMAMQQQNVEIPKKMKRKDKKEKKGPQDCRYYVPRYVVEGARPHPPFRFLSTIPEEGSIPSETEAMARDRRMRSQPGPGHLGPDGLTQQGYEAQRRLLMQQALRQGHMTNQQAQAMHDHAMPRMQPALPAQGTPIDELQTLVQHRMARNHFVNHSQRNAQLSGHPNYQSQAGPPQPAMGPPPHPSHAQAAMNQQAAHQRDLASRQALVNQQLQGSRQPAHSQPPNTQMQVPQPRQQQQGPAQYPLSQRNLQLHNMAQSQHMSQQHFRASAQQRHTSNPQAFSEFNRYPYPMYAQPTTSDQTNYQFTPPYLQSQQRPVEQLQSSSSTQTPQVLQTSLSDQSMQSHQSFSSATTYQPPACAFQTTDSSASQPTVTNPTQPPPQDYSLGSPQMQPSPFPHSTQQYSPVNNELVTPAGSPYAPFRPQSPLAHSQSPPLSTIAPASLTPSSDQTSPSDGSASVAIARPASLSSQPTRENGWSHQVTPADVQPLSATVSASQLVQQPPRLRPSGSVSSCDSSPSGPSELEEPRVPPVTPGSRPPYTEEEIDRHCAEALYRNHLCGRLSRSTPNYDGRGHYKPLQAYADAYKKLDPQLLELGMDEDYKYTPSRGYYYYSSPFQSPARKHKVKTQKEHTLVEGEGRSEKKDGKSLKRTRQNGNADDIHVFEHGEPPKLKKRKKAVKNPDGPSTSRVCFEHESEEDSGWEEEDEDVAMIEDEMMAAAARQSLEEATDEQMETSEQQEE